jgi:hypothetical protein
MYGGRSVERACIKYGTPLKLTTKINFCTVLTGRAMAQAVNRRPLTAESWVRARVNSCGICGGESGHWNRFFSEFFGFTLSISFYRVVLRTHMSSEG